LEKDTATSQNQLTFAMAICNAFNLEKQFSFYASYHRQPVNVAIHFLCIWPILATALTLLQVSFFSTRIMAHAFALP
jgi:uncharacterized membrane protein YGL010W